MRIFALAFISALLVSSIALAQPDTAWTAHIDLDHNVELFDVVEHSSGNFFLCGEVQGDNSYFDALIVRMDVVGDTLWTRNFGSPNSNERANGIAEISNGNVVFCGSAANGTNLLMACYTPLGALVWSKNLSFGTNTEGRGIVALPDGGFAAAARRGTGTARDFFILVCDQQGDTLWTRTYGSAFTDLTEDIKLSADGSFALAGTTQQGGTNFNFTLLRVDQEGNQLSLDYYGDASSEECLAFDQDADGGFLFGGYRSITNSRAAVLKTDSAGGSFWLQTFQPESLHTRVAGVAPFLGGGVICAGWIGNSVANLLWIGTVTSGGNLLDSWYWGTAISAFQQIVRLSDGGYLAIGHWDRGSINDGYVLRISPPSGIIGMVTDVETGDPQPGVQVRTTGSLQYAFTDSSGQFTLSLGPGTHNVVAYGACFDSDTVFNVVIEELQTVEVNLAVGVPHLIQNQTSINIIAQNQVASTGTLIMENTGSGHLHFRVSVETQEPASDWLTVIPSEGWIPPHESLEAEVRVLADTTNDASYDYFGTLHVSTNSCPDSTFDLPVIATVLDAENPVEAISDFALHPAYPNPFNAETRLTFDLPMDSEIQLKLFNIEGRLISELLSGRQTAGRHEVYFNGTSLASGIYIAHLNAGSFSANQKLILLK